MELATWVGNVGEETRNNSAFWLEDGIIARYLTGDDILDIDFASYAAAPILPHAIRVGRDYSGYDGKVLPFGDGSQDGVFVSHCLELIDDYRTVLADWFRVLRIGGHLVIAVPHQFLYERSMYLPSHFNLDHRRFYTPASLLREVEEAIDPCSYRVRLLHDNDRDFDYAIALRKPASGNCDILLVIEKIATPAWANDLLASSEIRDISVGTFSAFPRPDAHSPTLAIGSTPPPTAIIVFKMDHLGDFILATPALANLRRAFPTAFLTLVCGAWNAGEAQRSGLFDEVLPYSIFERNAALNGVTPVHERIAALRSLLGDRQFDLAIDLRVDDDSRFVLRHVQARQKAGIGHQRDLPYLDIALPMLSPTLTGRSGESYIDPSWFHAAIGVNQGYQIVVPAGTFDAGTNLIWGPYRSLHPSRYQLRLLMSDDAGDVPALSYDIVCDSGNRKLAAGQCEDIATTGVWLDLAEPVKDLEIRLWGRGDATPSFTFRGCRLSKEGQTIGPHQSEIMALLVALVEQRARFSPVEKAIA